MRPHRPRRAGAVALVAITLAALAGCGAQAAGPPVLTWYANPDSGGQKAIAADCTSAAQGRYRIAVSVLPREAGEQRQQLVRRLAAGDSSIDLMSLDPPFVPEFAEAGFLAPVPAQVADALGRDVVPSALQGASWRGALVTVPFWANTQLLWYRRSAVQAAGLDLTRPVTWEQVIAAARGQGRQVAAQGRRAESLVVWLNALVESAGGRIVTDPSPDDPAAVRLGLTAPPAQAAARVIEQFVQAGVGGPGFATASEDTNATAFERGDAIFMVNWPFVWSRANSAVRAGTLGADVLADYGWALYPRVEADRASAPPLGGIDIGVGAFSRHTAAAYEAARCITSVAHQSYYFATNGNPPASTAAYADPEVRRAFPMADTIRDSLVQAAPRPQTAYYPEVSESLQRVYHPPAGVGEGSGRQAADLIRAVLAKDDLL